MICVGLQRSNFEDDVILKQYDENLRIWEEIAAKEPNDDSPVERWRKSEVEIESVIKRIDLCRIAKEQLCFEEDDVILKQYEEKSKKWEEIAAKEPNDELTLERWSKVKVKKLQSCKYYNYHDQ